MRVGIYFGRFIFSNQHAGGAFTFQESILNALQKIDTRHEFYVFSDDCDQYQTKSTVNFVQLERHYARENEKFLKKLLLKIPRKIIRTYLTNKHDNPLNKAALNHKIELMWFATPAYEFVTIPFIYTVWDLEHRLNCFFPEVSVSGWKFEEREKRYNFVIPRAAYVIIGNQTGKNGLVKFYNVPEQRVKTVTLPTPDFVFNYQQASPALIKKYNIPSKYLFYPAQFWPHKNHSTILLAVKILKEQYNLDFAVVFTGSDKGNFQYIKNLAEELGLKKNVFFLGFVSIEELVALYQNAFALVFASFFGPDNIPPLEAFALGCPVISAKFAGAEDQLKDAALLFDPKNEHELAATIKNYMKIQP